MRVALIQGKSQNQVQANLDYYSNKIREAAKASAKLIVLPELVFTDYFPIVESKNNFSLAMNINAPEIQALTKLAKELQIVLTIPFYEKRADGVYHNSMLIAETDGSIIAHYRKMHIPDDPGFYEKYYFIPGDKGFVVADSSVGKLGLLICWDQWFPEAARINTLKGAQILIYPTAIGWDGHDPDFHGPDSELAKAQLDAWMTSMRGHAIANGVHVIAVNRVGGEGHLSFWGNSFVADPFGRILMRAGSNEETLYTEIDLEKTAKTRHSWPFIRDRRIEHYSDLLKIFAD